MFSFKISLQKFKQNDNSDEKAFLAGTETHGIERWDASS